MSNALQSLSPNLTNAALRGRRNQHVHKNKIHMDPPKTIKQQKEEKRSQGFNDLSLKEVGKSTIDNDLEHEANLWMQIWEAKSEKKELERFIGVVERRLGLQPINNETTSQTGKDLVQRMKRVLSITTSRIGNNTGCLPSADEAIQEIQHMFMSDRAGLGQGFSASQDHASRGFNNLNTATREGEYRPKKYSLTTFEFASTPRHSGSRVLTARPAWQPDHAATECPSCRTHFSMFNRRHHCRACGGLFDHKCCDNMVRIFSLRYNVPVRVCKFCLPIVVQANTKQQSKSSHGPYECSVVTHGDPEAISNMMRDGQNRRKEWQETAKDELIRSSKEGEHKDNGHGMYEDADSDDVSIERGKHFWHLDGNLQWKRGRRNETAPVPKRKILQQLNDPALNDGAELRLRADLLRQHLKVTRSSMGDSASVARTREINERKRNSSVAVDLVCDRF